MHLSGPTKLQLWIENWKELGVSTLICLGFLPLNSLYIYIYYIDVIDILQAKGRYQSWSLIMGRGLSLLIFDTRPKVSKRQLFSFETVSKSPRTPAKHCPSLPNPPLILMLDGFQSERKTSAAAEPHCRWAPRRLRPSLCLAREGGTKEAQHLHLHVLAQIPVNYTILLYYIIYNVDPVTYSILLILMFLNHFWPKRTSSILSLETPKNRISWSVLSCTGAFPAFSIKNTTYIHICFPKLHISTAAASDHFRPQDCSWHQTSLGLSDSYFSNMIQWPTVETNWNDGGLMAPKMTPFKEIFWSTPRQTWKTQCPQGLGFLSGHLHPLP